MKNLKQIMDSIAHRHITFAIAFIVISASIAFAVIADQARMNETQDFLTEHLLSDTKEENEANIDLFINSIK